MPKPSLADLAFRHQVYLERLKTGHVREFLAIFEESDAVIKSVLREAGVDVLKELSRPQLEKMITQLTQQQGELFAGAVDNFLEQMPALAVYEAQHQVRALASIASQAQRKKLGLPSAKDLAKQALERPIQAFGERVVDVAKGWAEGAVERTNKAIRTGYEQGKTVPEMVKALVGTKEMQFQDGESAINKRAAATVIRTGVQQVANTARAVTYEENEDVVVGYQWLSTLDGKTSSKCRALDGQKFKLNEGPMPPIHPNCRSTTVPTLAEEFDFLDEGATRSSQGGYVAADQSYYEWLKSESPEFQDGVLGPVRGKLFRDGGLTVERFRELQLDKNFEPMTLDEMRAQEPAAFRRAGLVDDDVPGLRVFAEEVVSRPSNEEITQWLDAWVAGDVVGNPKGNKFPLTNEMRAALVKYRLEKPTVLYRYIGGEQSKDLTLRAWTESEDFAFQLHAAHGYKGTVVKATVRPEQSIVQYTRTGDVYDAEGGMVEVVVDGLVPLDVEIIGHESLKKDFYLDTNGAPPTKAQISAAKKVANKIVDQSFFHQSDPRVVIPPKPAAPKVTGRPASGTATGTVWDTADELKTSLGRMPTRQEVLGAAKAKGINESTIGVQFGRWKNSVGESLGVVVPTPAPSVAVEKAVEKLKTDIEKTAEAPKTKERRWKQLLTDLEPLKTVKLGDTKAAQKAQWEMKELTDRYGDSNGVINMDSLSDEQLERFEELQELIDAGAAVTETSAGEDPRATLLQRLTKETGEPEFITTTILGRPLSESDQSKLNQATEFLESITHERLKKDWDLGVRVSSDYTTSRYDSQHDEILMRQQADVKVWVHELTHKIERVAGQESLNKAASFLYARRKGEPWKTRLNAGTPMKYFDDEWTKRGGKPYTSRIYYQGLSRVVEGTEVITTGVERLYENPVDFLQRDPEHFEVTIRTLLDLW